MAVSVLPRAPSAPNMIYAIIEADEENKGIYRSNDFGESWEKRSDHGTSSPQYYNELLSTRRIRNVSTHLIPLHTLPRTVVKAGIRFPSRTVMWMTTRFGSTRLTPPTFISAVTVVSTKVGTAASCGVMSATCRSHNFIVPHRIMTPLLQHLRWYTGQLQPVRSKPQHQDRWHHQRGLDHYPVW